MGTIISNIPATTPIGRLNLGQTGLILGLPPGLAKFTAMSELSLTANQLSHIASKQLRLTSSTLMKLDLTSNRLNLIEANSLPRK